MIQVYCRLKTASDAVCRTFSFRTTLQNVVVLVKTTSTRQVPHRKLQCSQCHHGGLNTIVFAQEIMENAICRVCGK